MLYVMGGTPERERAAPAASSRPWTGAPGMQQDPTWGYGPPQTYPVAPPPYGMPQTAPDGPSILPYAPAAARPRRSRRGLWIVLAVIVVLLAAAGGGGAYAYSRYAAYMAPAWAAGSFCDDLTNQNYSAAYELLSGSMRTAFTSDQFYQVGQALDEIEGYVTSCKQASGASNAYVYTPGGTTATVTVSLVRATFGAMRGQLHLNAEQGSWKVDEVDSSLFGVNLRALLSASAYCQALTNQDYNAAYAQMGSAMQAKTKQVAYIDDAQLHDQVDGKIDSCQLTGLGGANTDSQVILKVKIARGRLGVQQGSISLDVEGSSWRIASVDSSLQGSDLGAARTAIAFCQDLTNGNYAGVYALLSNQVRAGTSESDWASLFSGSYDGYKWNGCTLDLTTYQPKGTTATITADFVMTDVSTGASAHNLLALTFVVENGAWKLSDLQLG
jgi:NTF2-like N-terminal transpeptidase domain